MSRAAPGRATGQPAPAVLVQKVIAGDIDHHVVGWLQRAFKQRERQHAALPLDRYLSLPSFKAQRREQRDYWIEQAVQLIEGPNQSARFLALHREIERFMSRGPWRTWQREGGAPAAASDLQRCLFEIASNLHRAKAPGPKTISRKVKQSYSARDLSAAAGDTESQSRGTEHEHQLS